MDLASWMFVLYVVTDISIVCVLSVSSVLCFIRAFMLFDFRDFGCRCLVAVCVCFFVCLFWWFNLPQHIVYARCASVS